MSPRVNSSKPKRIYRKLFGLYRVVTSHDFLSACTMREIFYSGIFLREFSHDKRGFDLIKADLSEKNAGGAKKMQMTGRRHIFFSGQ